MQLTVEEIDAELERRRLGQSLAEEADLLSRDYRAFMRAAWHVVVPRLLVWSWHFDAIADHIQAAYEREIDRLLITIQPGAAKSTQFSVLAPAWRWTRAPEERIVSGSHRDDLATRDTRKTRELLRSGWFRARWPQVTLSADENLKTRYSNTDGGYRVATHVGGGTGERGSVLLIDDPHNADDVESDLRLDDAWDWWGNTWSSRLNASVDDPGVMMVIGQRVHEGDLIGRILGGDSERARWTHLCLPARYDPKHPFVYPDKVFTRSGRELLGDPRSVPGELLAPLFMDAATLADRQHDMTVRTVEAQYQQQPSPREGSILKRAHWQYYDPALLNDRDGNVNVAGLPRFGRIVHSWDTSFKDKTSSDFVVGTVWGVRGGNRYLLRRWKERANLGATKTAMKELRAWSLALWPRVAHNLLIENSANGPEIISQLKREIPGVTAIKVSTDKIARAEAVEPDLENGSFFLPGWARADLSGPDENQTAAWVIDFVETCARFPAGDNDDDVDSFTQAGNWIRLKGAGGMRTSVARGRVDPIQARDVRRLR